MTTLLTTDAAAVLSHVLVDILITNRGLGITDALLIECLVQTKVGHNCCNNGVGQQFTALFHVATVNIQDVVAGDDIALLIHTQATVGIAIVCKTNIQTFLHNELLQTLNVGRTGIVVDIQAIGLVVDDISICAQCIKDRFCNVPAGAVGTIQTNLDTFERVNAQRNQVAHVTVTTRHIVHGTADVLTMSKRQLWPVLIKDMEFAVDVIFY